MANYSMEDVELLRRMSGISLKEATALLAYHNGNVALALIDLERNGKLRHDAPPARESGSLLQRAMRTRLRVRHRETDVLNINVLLAGGIALFSPHLAVGAWIVALLTGCRLSLVTEGGESANEQQLRETVRSAVNSARDHVVNAAQTIQQAVRDIEREQRHEAQETAQPQQPAAPEMHYNTSIPASRPRAYHPGADVPTMQFPRKVDSQDGSVSIERDDNGYTSATIG